jgi:hypothetical protein
MLYKSWEALAHGVFVKNWTWTQSLNNTIPSQYLLEQNLIGQTCKYGDPKFGYIIKKDPNWMGGQRKAGTRVGFDKESKAHWIYWAE